jgi:aminoglycoside phosphotransferase (APT) family kinase protein/plasmid stabilization system protein ParE
VENKDRLDVDEVKRYLQRRAGASVQVEAVRELRGEATGATALKRFGYGRPLLVEYQVEKRTIREVFHRIRRNAFGRERDDDRAAAVWLDFQTFNHLPRHVPAVDMIVRTGQGTLRSIHSAEELLLVTTYRPGHLYADDLVRIQEENSLRPLDARRAEELAAYLARIHQVKQDDPMLWRRRLRDLVGHGEGIMGLTDSYPTDVPYVNESELRWIEEAANGWRWRLKPQSHRLSQVHGDFHPYNVLFRGLDYDLLDRSRGEWGEPADDVSCMTINYLFFSLQRSGQLEGPFRELHDQFWEHYLTLRPDPELLDVIQPWFAWRALVLASPVWYPTLAEDTRRKLLTSARRVLSTERYDHQQVNQYLEED